MIARKLACCSGRGGSLFTRIKTFIQLALVVAVWPGSHCIAQPTDRDLRSIETIVVIYAENRSFDALYGTFPGANGIRDASTSSLVQRDRDGSVLKELPPVWGGLTPQGIEPEIPQARTAHLPNRPFSIDDPSGFGLPLSVPTRDLWHRFYQNQMQINGGRNDMFVAYADAGALVMGHYDGSSLPMWAVARRYVLADNFFMGAFGGSFLNHIWLVCACAPRWPGADKNPANPKVSTVEKDGVTLTLASNSPHSAGEGPPRVHQRRQSHAGLLCSQHDATSLPAEQKRSSTWWRSGLRRSPKARHPAAADSDYNRRSA